MYQVLQARYVCLIDISGSLGAEEDKERCTVCRDIFRMLSQRDN